MGCHNRHYSLAACRLGRVTRRVQGQHLPPGAHPLRLVHASGKIAGCVIGHSVLSRFCVRRIRQHSSYRLGTKTGGYDWGYLAYAVGFGGSMIWFGSSAGVAICNLFPQAKSVGLWIKHGWYVVLAYILGFVVMLAVLGWQPNVSHKERPMNAALDTGGVSVEAYGLMEIAP